MYIDTHTHLFSAKFDEDREAVVKQAIAAEVKKMYLPNIDAASVVSVFDLCQKFPDNCFPMLGLHPCHVKENYQEELAKIKEPLFSHPEVMGVGETGLVYHWDLTFKKEQQDALRIQIEWAKELEIPIVLHTRESFEDSWNIINEMNDERLRGVFHCFSGDIKDAEKVMELGGFFMGIGGVVTFKKSGLAETVAQIPLEYLVLETDSPYLAPTPHRGKRNESSFIPYIANKIAEAKSMNLEDLATATTQNAETLFARVGVE